LEVNANKSRRARGVNKRDVRRTERLGEFMVKNDNQFSPINVY
jgi:hypothetical protein